MLSEINSQMYADLNMQKCLGKLFSAMAVSLLRHTEVKKWLSTNTLLIIKSHYVRNKNSGKMYNWAEMSILMLTFYVQQWANSSIRNSFSLSWITNFSTGWFYQAKNKGAKPGQLSKVVSIFTVSFSLLYFIH